MEGVNASVMARPRGRATARATLIKSRKSGNVRNCQAIVCSPNSRKCVSRGRSALDWGKEGRDGGTERTKSKPKDPTCGFDTAENDASKVVFLYLLIPRYRNANIMHEGICSEPFGPMHVPKRLFSRGDASICVSEFGCNWKTENRNIDVKKSTAVKEKMKNLPIGCSSP